MIPKYPYVRSKALMEAYRELPCQRCGRQDGTVCGAHANWGFGKGRGIKASDDRCASLCSGCHRLVDEGMLPKRQKQSIWWEAHAHTIRNLRARGLWPDGVAVPELVCPW